MTPEAFFLPARTTRGGQRFCLYHRPAGRVPRGAVVYVHPFAEEMNKARRMASLQARAMARGGYAVMQLDVLGCGDSSGEFGDASWDDWVDDILLACSWLRDRCDAPVWLWGLRAGCLLAADAARRLDYRPGLLFWHPATSGRQLLQQFLRFRVAGDLAEGNSKAAMESLRRQLASGGAVDVVGYRLSAGLAAGLERSELVPVPAARRLEWIELSGRADATLSPAAERVLEAWRQAGIPSAGRVVAGPAFWQTIDIEEAPDLLDATLQAMEEAQWAAA